MHKYAIKHNREFALFAVGGFTLIELLVSIVIVGLLAAIALPSYLNQAAKARGSEAKSIIGTLNRAQISYRLEKGTFGVALADLDVKVTGKFYSYGISAGVTNSYATATSTTQEKDLQVLSGGVFLTTSGDFRQTVCHSDVTVSTGTTAITPTSAELQSGVCPSNYNVLE
jgi:type IV pilus assembly protein PilA